MDDRPFFNPDWDDVRGSFKVMRIGVVLLLLDGAIWLVSGQLSFKLLYVALAILLGGFLWLLKGLFWD